MEFRILGPLEVLDDDTPVEVAGSKRRAVLALLLLHANEVVRTERLIDELWGDQAPRNAVAALHSHVSRLRKALGPELLARREWGYVLRAEPDSIDLHRFEELVAAAEPLPARERSAKLAEALRLWRGPALADLATELGLQTDIARLDEVRLTTLERRIDADLEAGRNSELVGEIEALIAAHPLREHLRWQLILALYRAGRQAEALEVYRETRRVLTEELGLEPTPALKELEKAILRQDPSLAATRAPAEAPVESLPRSVRRGVILAVLALIALALGVAAALALVEGTTSHRAVQAQPVAASSSVVQTVIPKATSTRPRRATKAPAARRPASSHNGRAHPRLRPRQVVATVAPTQPARTKRTATKGTKTPSRTRVGGASPTVPSKPAHPPPPKVVTISDNFDDVLVDPTIWQETCCDGTGVTAGEQNGDLEFAFAPDTTTGGQWNIAGGIFGTQCKFPSDFDARVDYTLVQWPAANGVIASLWAFFGPANVGYEVTRSSSAAWGEQLGAWIGSEYGGSVPIPDTSGTLRLARANGVLTAYFLHKGNWQSLGSRRIISRATIALGASVGSGTGTSFGGRRVVVDFDNFTVTGADPVCPPGTQPPG